MAAESELIKLREELKEIQDSTLRWRRRAAFGFVIVVCALALCLQYAFVQQVAATRNAEEAVRHRVIAEKAESMARQNAEEANRQQAIATAQRAAAVKMLEETREALAKCKRKK